MARKMLVNCTQQIGTTGLSQVTLGTLTATGNSQEFYEFATADAARFYADVTAPSGTVTFNLQERDPATGLFFTNNPGGFFGSALTGTVSGTISTVDPVYAEAYQVAWTITGTVTASVVAQLILRGT